MPASYTVFLIVSLLKKASWNFESIKHMMTKYSPKVLILEWNEEKLNSMLSKSLQQLLECLVNAVFKDVFFAAVVPT